MRAKSIWAVQSFLTCFIVNALLLTSLYIVAIQVIGSLNQWVDPFLQQGSQGLPADARSSFTSLKEFLTETKGYLAPTVLGVGGLATFILWLLVHLQGRGLANRIERSSLVVTPAPQAKVKGVEPSQPAGAAAPQVAAIAAAPSPQAAVQILSILQRQGRLIDFLQEDLTPYDDSQIGAAVRSIHQGCREALQEHMDLKPIFGEPEGEPVSVPAGFDSRAVRLTGNISGDPPFKGTLRHRGWRVERLELPRATTEQTKDWVIAPAEVEIEN